ncbi:MAG: hypothetical protein JNJ71_18765 [Rubrivivax sp.]|nr:hypothetical protein [Rubrivivax sp.]
MTTLYEWLGGAGVWKQVVASGAASELLQAMQPLPDLPADAAASHEGLLQLAIVKNPLGPLSLSLTLPAAPRAFALSLSGPPGQRTGFRVAVDLTQGGLQRSVLSFLEKLPGLLLHPAERVLDGGQQVLRRAAGTVSLEHEGLWLVVSGEAGSPVRLSLSADKLPPEGLVKFSLKPSTVMLADTGFGLELPEGLWLDDSSVGQAPGTSLDGQLQPVRTPADDAAWHGLVIRRVRFYLPRGVPLLGGHAVDGHLHVGLSPTPGIDLVLRAEVPAEGDRPPMKVLIECRDPAATGLEGLVPTYAEIEMSLPWPRKRDTVAGMGAFTVGGGKPVKARARFARAAATAQQPLGTVMSLALESQGPDGLLRVDSQSGEAAAKVVVAAATTASALAADGAGPALQTLLTAAVGLSSFLHSGKFVIHSAQLLAELDPASQRYALLLDYSVDAVVDSLGFGPLQISMKRERPMKLRARDVRLTVDPSRSGLAMFDLDFQASRMEVEDPGGWQVGNLRDLFDVTGTRAGRGSQWFEVDLRFRIDLGPVRVSGATLRATFDWPGAPKISLRGLEAAVQLQPLIKGQGGVQLSDGGFSASLAVTLVPLGLGAQGDITVQRPMVKLGLGVEFPGPLPLANSGLALYALGGVFAANGQPRPPAAGADPVQHQLDWDPYAKDAFVPASAFSFGLEAVIGTAPDMGFSFSARAGIFIRTPEVAVRGSLSGRVMGPRVGLARSSGAELGVRARGVVVIDPQDAVMVAVEGRYSIPSVLDVRVPFAARFPVTAAQLNQWYVHLGADGHNAPGEGRQMGPVRMVLLPGILDQGADGYLMLRGNGITAWPRGKPGADYKGFICAFGAGFTAVWGLKPIVWAEIHARADVLLATSPLTLAGRAQVGGSLHVTIFSVGVEASLEMLAVQGHPAWIKAEVCGHIELLFTTIRRCVRLEIGSRFVPQPPAPASSPLAGPQHLVDDRYQVVAELGATREEAAAAPAVWPDAIPLLVFGTAPQLAGLAAPQFPAAASDPDGPRAAPQGDENLRYEWRFTGLELTDVTDAANPQPVPGPLSSAWLKAKFDAPNVRAQPAELALLTPDAGMWLSALSQAGSGLPHQPLQQLAEVCRRSVEARIGVAVGHAASPWGAEGDVLLPPDPVSTDPLQSQPRVLLRSRFGAPALARPPRLDERWAAGQSLPMLLRSPARVALDPSFAVQDVALREAFDPGGLLPLSARLAEQQRFNRMSPRQQLEFEAFEPLTRIRLWLLWPGPLPAPLQADASSIRVSDEHGQTWAIVERHALADGAEALAWAPPLDQRTRAFQVDHPLTQRWCVLAVEGLTDSARQAAEAQNQALRDEAERQRTANAQGPATTAVPNAPGRCVLLPGRVYELRARLHWKAVLKCLDEGTEKQSVREGDAEHRWYWRTAAVATAGNTPADTFRLLTLRPWQQSFAPQMIQRHVRGFEPAQSVWDRFANDPASVHFGVSHVGALLDAYGLEAWVRVRRVDVPAVPDIVKKPKWTWATQAVWMGEAEALRAAAAAASPCALPQQQASATVTLKLGVRATYELGLEVQRKGAPLSGPGGTWISGVTFSTSRWRDAREMMVACGFGTGGPAWPIGRALGDVALRDAQGLQPQQALGSDAALQQWLAAQSMDGWPAPDQPRISQLWRQAADGSWQWRGVWLESPEPLQRPGRTALGAWALRSGNRTQENPFDIQLSDSAGTRWLLASSVPLALQSVRIGVRWVNPRLRMTLLDQASPGVAPVPRTGWLELAMQPTFVLEAL